MMSKENSIRRIVNRNVDRLLVKEFLMKNTKKAGFGGLDIVRTRPGNPPIDRSGRRFDIVKPLPAKRGLKHSIDQIQDVVFHRPTRWHGKVKDRSPSCRSSCGGIDSRRILRGFPTRTRT